MALKQPKVYGMGCQVSLIADRACASRAVDGELSRVPSPRGLRRSGRVARCVQSAAPSVARLSRSSIVTAPISSKMSRASLATDAAE